MAPAEGLEPSDPEGRRFSRPLRYQLRCTPAYVPASAPPAFAASMERFVFTTEEEAGSSVGPSRCRALLTGTSVLQLDI